MTSERNLQVADHFGDRMCKAVKEKRFKEAIRIKKDADRLADAK